MVKWHLFPISMALFANGISAKTGLTTNDLGETRTHEQAVFLTYSPKPFAFLSMFASYVMIRELLRDNQTNQGGCTPIQRMLISVAVADVLFSLAVFVGTWAAPSTGEYPHTVLGNVGTVATCTAFGFIGLFGYVASILANTILSTYYLRIVLYGWRDTDLKRVELWTQGALWVIALGCAIYPIPLELYNLDDYICGLAAYPPDCDRGVKSDDCLRGSNAEIHRTIFAILPMVCLLVIVGIMISIVVKVRQVEDKTKNYAAFAAMPAPRRSSASVGHSEAQSACVNSQKSQAVAIQGMCYAVSFLLTYLLLLISILEELVTGATSPILAYFAWSVFLPMAGVFNFWMFARLRQMKTPEGRFLRATLFCTCWCWAFKTCKLWTTATPEAGELQEEVATDAECASQAAEDEHMKEDRWDDVCEG